MVSGCTAESAKAGLGVSWRCSEEVRVLEEVGKNSQGRVADSSEPESTEED